MARATFTGSDFTLHRRALDCIAQGALTNSKRPECLVKGVYPTHLVRGKGARVWDAQGRSYIDFIAGLGSSILGFGNEQVAQAIYEQALRGPSLSLGTELEIQVAEKVKELFPFIERVKIFKNGSDACDAAVRIARTKTDRSVIASQGYHGSSDGFVSLSPPACGVKDTHRYISIDQITDWSELAAVIVEPVMTDASLERINWLGDLRKKCTESGALLIFDEIITGFRYPDFSVSNHYGIRPDLICLGKAMANGMPISIVGGRDDIMNCGEYFLSKTFNGEMCSLAAALKTMTLLQSKFSLDLLWEKGILFQKAFNGIWQGGVWIEGYATRGRLCAESEMTKALFMQEACKGGILMGPSFFFNFAHFEHMDGVLSVFKDVMTKIRTGSVKLEGDLPSSPFSQQQREKK